MSTTTTDRRAPAPRLITTKLPHDPVGVALVLHGGGGRGTAPVRPTQLSVLRMVPVAMRIGRAGHGRLAVFRLLNAVRGFGADPLSNVRWALQRIAEQCPQLPVALVGHSLGGSVALAAAGDGSVRSVVALAPWLSGSESVGRLGDVAALIVHGAADRVTSCAASKSYAARARGAGAPVSFVQVNGGEHTMLRRMPVFDVLAARFTTATLDREARRPAHTYARLDALALAARDTPGEYEL